MKFICTQSKLNASFSLVSRAVPARPTHPVLANVLMKADIKTQQISLTAFDLSLGIWVSLDARIETEGAIALPAKLLGDIISRLPEGEIQFDIEDEAPFRATILSASGKYQVRGMESGEFPELPTVKKGKTIFLPADALKEGLKGTLFSASDNETKQVLTGVHISSQAIADPTEEANCVLEFASTDGHRLSVVRHESLIASSDKNESAGDVPQIEVTLPAKALRELERMLGARSSSEPLAMHFESGQVVFEWENQQLTSRTLEGQYPAYNQLIPHQFERQITLDRRQLLTALERIAVLADQKNNVVRFDIDSVNQQIDLSVEAQDVGSGRESLPIQIDGDSMVIAFNVKYLMEGLKAVPSFEVQMFINQPDRPVILMPIANIKMTYLIMPVKVRD